MSATGVIRLFDGDPDLLAQIPAAERDMAARSAVMPMLRLGSGAWTPPPSGGLSWGVLVAEGLIVREVGVAGTTAAELIGAGDVLVTGGASGDAMVSTEEAWTVLEQATLVVLEAHFMGVARRWPLVTACLLQRAERRATRLAVAQAISHLNRVDTRVLVMLWSLADRWGRVGTDAIVLPLRLTHRTIARLVGARRPTVTTAITELGRRELLARREDGSWLLRGPPPAELERVGLAPLPAQPAPPPRRRNGQPPERARMATDMRRLAEAYERQTERARAIGAASEATRERSRLLREDLAARRTERRDS